MSDEFPTEDVRAGSYLPAVCSGCGRLRLELFVDGSDDPARAVGIECEKCGRQWLLTPESADFYGDYANNNPLRPQAANDPFNEGEEQ